MLEPPYKSVRFIWLASAASAASAAAHDPPMDDDVAWFDYPLPPEVGTGGYTLINLAVGSTLADSSINFTPQAVGQLMPLASVDAHFKEPTFQAFSMRGLRFSFNEALPPGQFALSAGVDLFRHTRHYQMQAMADFTYSGSCVLVAIGLTTLVQLIGADVVEKLFARLGIADAPTNVAGTIPLHVSNPLFGAIAPGLTSTPRKLFAQARVLQYLSSLIDHVCGEPGVQPAYDSKARQRAQAVHAQLMAIEGKLPTLDELAEQHGRSAKLLNEEFQQEFGQSIYAFITDHRLNQAHAALKQTDLPIKSLAGALGYAHVSNFTIAFKRKFGYPPGHLRRRGG